MSEDRVESPAAVAPAVEEPKKPAPVKKVEPPKQKAHGFDLDDETVHQKYFIPPAGYKKPNFPTPQ